MSDVTMLFEKSHNVCEAIAHIDARFGVYITTNLASLRHTWRRQNVVIGQITRFSGHNAFFGHTKYPTMEKVNKKLAEIGDVGQLMCWETLTSEEDDSFRESEQGSPGSYFSQSCSPILVIDSDEEEPFTDAREGNNESPTEEDLPLPVERIDFDDPMEEIVEPVTHEVGEPQHMEGQGPNKSFWVFTDNDGDMSEGMRWDNTPHPNIRYMCWQVEHVTRDHIQGYVELFKSRKSKWLHNNISKTACFFVRRGSQAQAIEYCTSATYKGKDKGRVHGPYSVGEKSKGCGSRTDLIAFREAIKEGKRKRHLIESMPQCMHKYRKFYHDAREIYRPKRNWETNKMEVSLALGEPGMGKTRYAYDKWEDSHEFYTLPVNNGTIWFDGYDDHKIVLMDEFCGKFSAMRLDVLLKILDGYVIRVPVKGDHTWWMPSKIWITSNIKPGNWYKWEGRENQKWALKRRIHHVYDFDNKDAEGNPKEITDTLCWEPDMVDYRDAEGRRDNNNGGH